MPAAATVPMASKEDIGKFTGTTRVLISFGGAAGGFEFAMQLRSDILRSRGTNMIKADPALVYIDAESLAREPFTKIQWNRDRGLNVMSNPAWDHFYQGAMNSCQTMIFLITKQWLESQYCWEELGWFQQRLPHKSIKPIFVVFPDARELLALQSITLRDGTRRNPSAAWRELQQLSRVTTINIETPPIPALSNVIWEGTRYTYQFMYSCSEVELRKIIDAIKF